MAIPAHILERLPISLRKNGLIYTSEGDERRSFLRSGSSSAGPDGPVRGRLHPGGVTEVVSRGGSFGTSLGLQAIREVQAQALARGAALPLVGVVTWGASLYAPGLERRKVELGRVLVVEPTEDSLERVVLRMVESRLFELIVIDLVGIPGAGCELFLGGWGRTLRRMQLALEGTERSVLLLTSEFSRRPFPLPVSERWELRRSGPREVTLRSAKTGGPWKKHEFGILGPVRARSEREEVRHGAAS
jgi:recombination protein RecA